MCRPSSWLTLVTRSPRSFSNQASAIVVPVSQMALDGRVVGELAEVQLVVGASDRPRIADLDHVAVIHQHRAVAEALDGVHVV